MVDRLDRQDRTRAEKISIVQIVVVGVARPVGQRHARGDRERIGAEDRTDIAAAVRDAAKRREIPAIVPLRAVGHAEIVAMPRRRARGVFRRDNPRRDIALGQGGSRRPVGRTGRGADRQVRHAPREVARREQLLRSIERARRQQVELSGERRRRQQVRREPGRRDGACHEAGIAKPVAIGHRIAVEDVGGKNRVLENAPARVTQTPRDLAMVVFDFPVGGGSFVGRRAWRFRSAHEARIENRPPVRGMTQRDRRRHAHAGGHVDHLSP